MLESCDQDEHREYGVGEESVNLIYLSVVGKGQGSLSRRDGMQTIGFSQTCEPGAVVGFWMV